MAFVLFLLAICISFLVVQCTPVKKYEVLSFFFDGVPQPNKKIEATVAVHDSVIVLAAKPEFYTHRPYEEDTRWIWARPRRPASRRMNDNNRDSLSAGKRTDPRIWSALSAAPQSEGTG